MVHAFNCSLALQPPLPVQRQMLGLEAREEPGGGLATRLFYTGVSTSVFFCSLLRCVFVLGLVFCFVFFPVCQAHLFPAAQALLVLTQTFYLLTYCTVRSHLSLRKPKRSQVPVCCHLTHGAWPRAGPRAPWPVLTVSQGSSLGVTAPGWGCCSIRCGTALLALCCQLWRTFWDRRTQTGQETWPCVWMIPLERGGGRSVLDSRGQSAAAWISLSAHCKAGSSGDQVISSGVNCLQIRVLPFYLDGGKLWVKQKLKFSRNMQ